MKKTLRTSQKASFAIAATVLTVMMSTGTATANGLQSQLNTMFDSMVNVTTPGVYETQSRGVFIGGRFTVKNKIYSENVVSFVPPSLSAGCGGIDFFGGSFSFINSEQLTQLFRAVAANAAGYAFKLALSVACPSCATFIETLQKKIQELNQFLGNSCQLAQGLVNDATNLLPLDIKNKTDYSLVGKAKGLFQDFFESSKPSEGRNPAVEFHRTASPDEKAKFVGNVVWVELQRNTAQYWFSYGDSNLLAAMMSLTGSVIVHEPDHDDSGSGTSDADQIQPVTHLPGNKISLRQLIDGGNDIEIYRCSDDLCMEAGSGSGGTQVINLIGLGRQLEDVLLGPNNQPGEGVVGKYAHNLGMLSPTESALMSNLPQAVGSMLVNLSAKDELTARVFIRESIQAIALVLADQVAEQLFRATKVALGSSPNAFSGIAQQRIMESREAVKNEYMQLLNLYGNVSTLIERYNALNINLRDTRMLIDTPPQPANR